ncbi:MAG TPA: hypothetical protein VII98_02415 [Solirubrobacteraceae bacterium]
MSTHRTTFRHIVLAVVAAALSAALLAGPAAARPVHGPLLHGDRLVPVAQSAAVVVKSAPPTSAASSYRNGFAANVKGFSATHAGQTGSGGSATPWIAIGIALLGAALVGGVAMRRQHRHGPQRTPSFGA